MSLHVSIKSSHPFCLYNMAKLQQNEVQSRDYALLLLNDFKGFILSKHETLAQRLSARYHTCMQHCTLETFKPCRLSATAEGNEPPEKTNENCNAGFDNINLKWPPIFFVSIYCIWATYVHNYDITNTSDIRGHNLKV